MITAGAILLGIATSTLHAAAPPYRIIAHASLQIRTTEPTFVALSSPRLLDRGNLLMLGRPLSNRSAFIALNLDTLQTSTILIPGIPGPWVPAPDQLVVDEPAYYDTANAKAGLVLRAGGSVSGDAAWAEWDLRTNTISRRLPIVSGKGSNWTSVTPIGYDPDTGECFLEIVRCTPETRTLACNESGPHELTILGITDRIRTIAKTTTALRFSTKWPYFDPVHRRSMHIEYAECPGLDTTAYLVDLDSGTVKTFTLPKVIYGFAFDADGRTGYVYSEGTSEVFTLDLEAGKTGPRKKFGGRAHLLDWIGPNLLCLGRDHGMVFIDPATMRQTGFINPADFHQGPTHLEGSTFMPGLAIVRIYQDVYVLEFPGLQAQ